MSKPIPMHDQRGKAFTLIEVVVAMVVFSLGFMGVLGLTLWFVRADVFNARMSNALALGQSRMEILMYTDPSDLAGGSSSSNEFSCVWAVDSPFTNMDLHALSVDVSWEDGRGQTHQVSLNSLMSEPP